MPPESEHAQSAPNGHRDRDPKAIREIRVDNVSVYYGREPALFRCKTHFAAGQVAVIMGPNGAGKSTLLRLLATLQRPDEGQIWVDRLNTDAHRADIRPHIGLVAHELLLYNDLTATENLSFFASLYGVSAEHVPRWLERVGLTSAASQRVSGYSRGMRQRLAIARALIHNPSIVLMDEPLTGLDRSAKDVVWNVLADLRSRGVVVIVVTHQLDTPSSKFDRALVIERGRIRYDGPTDAPLEQIYARALGG